MELPTFYVGQTFETHIVPGQFFDMFFRKLKTPTHIDRGDIAPHNVTGCYFIFNNFVLENHCYWLLFLYSSPLLLLT